MSNIQTGAERMPHDLSHLGFLAVQIGRLITISTPPVITGDSFEMDAVGALRLSPLRRGLAIVFFASRRRHTRLVSDWSSDVCSSDLLRLRRVLLSVSLAENERGKPGSRDHASHSEPSDSPKVCSPAPSASSTVLRVGRHG